jgi:hypothetical protein
MDLEELDGAAGAPVQEVVPAVEDDPIQDANLEIDGDDDVEPTPIAAWMELTERDESVGLDADLLYKIRNLRISGDEGDASRRIPGNIAIVL